MTHPAITVASQTTVRAAQQIMHDYHIRHLPVVDGSKLVGIISSGDIRRAAPSSATSLSVWEMHYLWEKITVGEVMTRPLITVMPDTSMLEAVRLLYEYRFNSLPVMDADGKLVGIVTEVDLYLLLLRECEDIAPVESEFPVAVLP
jgi:CBS domain-containing protein